MGGTTGQRGYLKKTQELYKMKANRLISGHLIINVRHDDPDATGSNEFDVNQAFASTNDSSTNIPIDGWRLAGVIHSAEPGGGMWSAATGQYPYRGARPNFKNKVGSTLTTAMATTTNSDAAKRTIDAFTTADPGVITVTDGHFFSNNDEVTVYGVGSKTANGKWEGLNGNTFRVLNVSENTLQLGTATDNVLDSGPGTNLVDTSTPFTGDYDDNDKGYLIGASNRRYYSSINSWSSDSDDTTATANATTIKSKKLSLGDYDSFCYYVTAALSTSPSYSLPGTRRHRVRSNEYYFSKPSSHDACQSFVKSHLISRINNSTKTNYEDMVLGQHTDGPEVDESDVANIDLKKGMMKGGLRRIKYTIPSSDGLGRFQQTDKDHHIDRISHSGTTTNDHVNQLSAFARLGMNCDLSEEEYLFSNGIYSHTSGFGMDLGDREKDHFFRANGEDNNNFFTPVYDVDIYAYHPSGVGSFTQTKDEDDLPVNTDRHSSNDPGTWFDISSDGNPGNNHSESVWYLAVDVYHWSFIKNDGSSYPDNLYCPVNVEIMWQPFGETAELEIS